MARVAEHLSIAELEERFRTAKDPILARHVQVIWLLAQGHTSAEVSTVISFVPRWIEPLRARYKAEGFAALGDLRRHNGRAPSLLKPDLLERLRASAWPIRRPMAGCGRVGKWRAGWPASSGLPRSVSNVAGRLCARSRGRSRSRARVIRRRPRPRRNPRLKKTRRSRCRRGRAP